MVICILMTTLYPDSSVKFMNEAYSVVEVFFTDILDRGYSVCCFALLFCIVAIRDESVSQKF
jgi:hypothetical protein